MGIQRLAMVFERLSLGIHLLDMAWRRVENGIERPDMSLLRGVMSRD